MEPATKSTLTATCHCKAVRLTFPTPTEDLNSCQCSICRRYGTLWAYYTPAQVQIEGPTATYIWGDKTIAFHHCPDCGCVTHWASITGEDGIGVNCRMLEREDLVRLGVKEEEGPE